MGAWRLYQPRRYKYPGPEIAKLAKKAGNVLPEIANPSEGVGKAVQEGSHIAQGARDATATSCWWGGLGRSVLNALHNLFQLGDVRIVLNGITNGMLAETP
ncbi:hypothetical protein N0V82_007892 [Gnomoniopsis sp. IMI 355080]|nr:hypothetical protein N0V82_007892 [Gnomoniopsis sp. IMI 355080]